MSEIGYAALGIIPSFDGFQGKLEQGTSKHMAAAGTSGGSKFGDSAGKAAKGKFSSMAKGIVAPLLGAFAAVKVKDFLGDSIAEARESQKVGAITTQVIKSTGSAAKVTAQQVGDLASAISSKTGMDDEAIQAGANMLLTFKGIRNEAGKGNKIFDRTTGIVTDMAAAMAGGKGGDIDLKSASIQVGKALNDPLKGITALAKVGVSFTKQQKAQIKALVEGGTANAAIAMGLIDSTTTFNNLLKQNKGDVNAVVDTLTKELNPAQKKTFDYYEAGGHTLEAQKRILKELNSEFGGTAAAQATAGEKIKVAWGNIKEGIGTGLLPVIDDVENALLKKGVPAANRFVDWFGKKGVPALRDFATEAQPVVKSILPAIGTALDKTKDAAAFIAPKLKSIFDGFNSLPDWVKTTVILGAGSVALGKKLGVGSLLGSKRGGLGGGSGLLGVVSHAKPIPVFVVNGGAGGGIPGVAGKAGGAAGAGGKVEKFGKWGGLLGVPGLVAAGTGVALAKGHPLSGMPPITGMASKAITGFVEKRKIDDQTASVLRQHDAWLKVRGDYDRGKTGAENLTDKVFKLDVATHKVEGRHAVKFEAPNLVNLLDNVRRYGSMLDGLNRTVKTTFVTNVVRHQAGSGGTSDSGESVGKHSPTVAQRGGVTVIHNGDIRTSDPNDYLRDMHRRSRAANGGGVNF